MSFGYRVTIASLLAVVNEHGAILLKEEIFRLLQFDTPLDKGIPSNLIHEVLGVHVLESKDLTLLIYPYESVNKKEFVMPPPSRNTKKDESCYEYLPSRVKSTQVRRGKNSRGMVDNRGDDGDESSILDLVATAYVVNNLVSGSDYSSSSSNSSYDCSSSSSYDSGSSCSSWGD